MAVPCISATGLTVAFEPDAPVFYALDVCLAAEPVALIGLTSVGKSLLADALSRYQGNLIIVTHSKALARQLKLGKELCL